MYNLFLFFLWCYAIVTMCLVMCKIWTHGTSFPVDKYMLCFFVPMSTCVPAVGMLLGAWLYESTPKTGVYLANNDENPLYEIINPIYVRREGGVQTCK